ncbi:2-(1,2-epoxy-1,2-dihydrophenyl)acetyl-CoA isomerase PaaG [Marinimicrococcus flavescens]|uniref:2-(1,2-epoxy-1,2-dihydrophenyl)acetyl-CoA isomerase PaaG n=1 Tax=Marinimicrococcus flavescens TaxID=3031815 RepID=A0AAP3V0W8_9PROT|nr:2-(1,2-epoxy-1,2-dihydrophenyl)acetyl-CoA isomerase PaaG [Marinimicrococcus flavescens]
MTEATVLGRREGGVLVLTLNRPARLNSFNEAMHTELAAALDAAAADRSVRAVLLTGAGRAFCAGQDLSERQMGEGAGPPDLGDTLERLYNPLVRRLRALDRPVVCAVNGVAAGAGANVALACDIVLAARSASFIQAFCKIGLVPDSGGTFFLPRLVGDVRARGLALLGESLPAEKAAEWGLIWKAVDDERLEEEAMTLATHLASQPTRALGMIKRALDASAGNGLDAQLDLERDLQREAGRTEDYREGVRAFMEKRPARFGGS